MYIHLPNCQKLFDRLKQSELTARVPRVFTLWIWFDGNLGMESKHLLNQNRQILFRNQLPELCTKLRFRLTQISFNFVSTSIDRHRPGAEFNFRLNLLRNVIPKQEFNYTSKGLLTNSYLTKIDARFCQLFLGPAMNSGERVWIVLSKGRTGSYRAVSTSPSGQLKTESQPLSLHSVRMTTWTEKQKLSSRAPNYFIFLFVFRLSVLVSIAISLMIIFLAAQHVKELNKLTYFFLPFDKVFQLSGKLRRRWILRHELCRTETFELR